jgi:RimJ/RimL family protein N-acetyltransferase
MSVRPSVCASLPTTISLQAAVSTAKYAAVLVCGRFGVGYRHPVPPIDLPIVLSRVTLRAFTMGDRGTFADLNSRPDVARFLYWEARTPEESRAALVRKTTETAFGAEGEALSLAVVRNEDDTFLGEVILRMVDAGNRGAEVGFIFHPDHHGHGYAGEAAHGMLELAFESLGMHRVIGRCDARNEASARLMRRLGMRQEAHFRSNEQVKGEWSDELVFALLDDEWPATPAG